MEVWMVMALGVVLMVGSSVAQGWMFKQGAVK